MKVFSFRNLRVAILLFILAYAAIYTKQQRLTTTSWYKPITVTIFPINGDNTTKTAEYISQLTGNAFQDIDRFFARNAKKYDLIAQQPIQTELGSSINSLPPSPPADRNSTLSAVLWSLKLRYWAYKHTPDSPSNSDRIRLFVIYHQQNNRPLSHSLGLQKGLLGVIHAYANQQQDKQNTIVMTHEIFHTVGATDKYDLHNQPLYPIGYADPDKQPLYPQDKAEIMAGRLAISAERAEMPASLGNVIVGHTTAREVNWLTTP